MMKTWIERQIQCLEMKFPTQEEREEIVSAKSERFIILIYTAKMINIEMRQDLDDFKNIRRNLETLHCNLFSKYV